MPSLHDEGELTCTSMDYRGDTFETETENTKEPKGRFIRRLNIAVERASPNPPTYMYFELMGL